jgi:hypothetical protein
VTGHARSVGRLRQCRDRQSDPLAWLARAVVVLFSEPLCSGGLICRLEVGYAAVLQVWVLDVQRSTNDKDGLVMKATSAMTVGLIVGVSGSGSLDWSLGLVNVDGWVWRQGARQEQVRQIAPKIR